MLRLNSIVCYFYRRMVEWAEKEEEMKGEKVLYDHRHISIFMAYIFLLHISYTNTHIHYIDIIKGDT